jgi:hypothetical protein
VRSRSAAGTLSLLRQGLTLGVDYGTHSLGALLAVAETVEQAVYEPGSLRRIAGGLAFSLENPPLRVGSFYGVAVRIGDAPVPPGNLRLRKRPATVWRTGAEVTRSTPYDWGPGEATDFELTAPVPAGGERVCVRLELRPLAIPPLVWCEIREVPSAEAPRA